MSGAVIKADQARFVSRGMYSLDLRDISLQANDMIAAARAEADRLVAEARGQAEATREAIRQKAQRDGHAQGLAEGRATGQAEALAEARERFAKDQMSLTAALRNMLEAFNGQREKLYLAARRDVIVLAAAVARRILAKLPELDEAAAAGAVEACAEALDVVRGATEVVVRVHPDDWAAVDHLAEDLGRALQGSRNIRVVEDASIGRGGVVVESEESTVDAQAASRVDRIATELVAGWQARMKELSLES